MRNRTARRSWLTVEEQEGDRNLGALLAEAAGRGVVGGDQARPVVGGGEDGPGVAAREDGGDDLGGLERQLQGVGVTERPGVRPVGGPGGRRQGQQMGAGQGQAERRVEHRNPEPGRVTGFHPGRAEVVVCEARRLGVMGQGRGEAFVHVDPGNGMLLGIGVAQQGAVAHGDIEDRDPTPGVLGARPHHRGGEHPPHPAGQGLGGEELPQMPAPRRGQTRQRARALGLTAKRGETAGLLTPVGEGLWGGHQATSSEDVA